MKLDNISITFEQLGTKSEKLMLGSHIVASVSQVSHSPCRGFQEASLRSAQCVQARCLVHGTAVLTSLATVLPSLPTHCTRIVPVGLQSPFWLGNLDDVEFPYIYATWERARSGCSLPETWFKALLTHPSYFLSCSSLVFSLLWWEMQFYLCDSVCYRVVLVHPPKYLWLTERHGEEKT